MFWTASVRRAGLVSGPENMNPGIAWLGCDVEQPDRLSGGGNGLDGEAVAAVRGDSTAAPVVTGLVRWAALLVSQARAAVLQRGADIPGRPLDGGQATIIAATVPSSLTASPVRVRHPGSSVGWEVPGFCRRDNAGSSSGGVDPVGSLPVILAISLVEHLHGPAAEALVLPVTQGRPTTRGKAGDTRQAGPVRVGAQSVPSHFPDAAGHLPRR